MKYKRKPEIVEAMQWTGENEREIFEFLEGRCYATNRGKLVVETSYEDEMLDIGDYIMKDDDGDIYPYEREFFEMRYEVEV